MSKLYFFDTTQYSRYDVKRDAADPDYPKPIDGNWEGVTAASIDAVLNWGDNRAFFFTGDQYYRYDVKRDCVDGNARNIADGWPGLRVDGIDACINWNNGKVWFFRGSQYWQYDMARDSVDAGFPRPIADKWTGDFASGLDGAINFGNGKAYFFKGDEYVRFDVRTQSIEAGWPKSIGGQWSGLFEKGVRGPVMLGYAGFDRLIYPGDAVMQHLFDSTNLTWCGFYLTPSPSQKNTSWMTHYAFLRSIGWGVAPIYVGQQQPEPKKDNSSHDVSAAQGTTDGAEAVERATQAGIEAGSVIYLDIETGNPIQPALADYYQAWNDAVIAGGFQPGVYCSHLQARALKALDARPVFWVFNIDRFGMAGRFEAPFTAIEPLFSGVEFTAVWQLAQNSALVMPGGQAVPGFDFDTCSRPDPSQIP